MARTATYMHAVPVAGGMGSTDATLGVHNECVYSVVDVANNSTTVYTGAAILCGVYVNTALSAHVLPIADGAVTVVSLPASAAAGTSVLYPGIRFETSIVVDPNDAATGSVTVAYRPL